MPSLGSGNYAASLNPGLAGGLSYVNDVLGGVQGHPLKLDVCNSDSTAAVEVNCANKLVSDRVPVVFDLYDGGFAAAFPILQRAGVAIFGIAPRGALENNSDYPYFFGPPLEAFASGPLVALHTEGIDTFSTVIPDLPSSVAYVNGAILPVAKKLGMKVSVTYYDPGTANWSVIAASLLRGNPQATGTISGTESDCESMLKAIRVLNFKGPVLMGSCTDYITADPADAENTLLYSSSWLPNLASVAPAAVQTQVAAYKSAMAKAGTTDVSTVGQVGVYAFAGLADLQLALKSTPAPYTGAMIDKALSEVKDVQSFMGPTVTCNHNQWPKTSSCIHSLLLLKVNNSGQVQTLAPGGFLPINTNLISLAG
jgi:branched-chain amino acid transport system substrate-binding protein